MPKSITTNTITEILFQIALLVHKLIQQTILLVSDRFNGLHYVSDLTAVGTCKTTFIISDPCLQIIAVINIHINTIEQCDGK